MKTPSWLALAVLAICAGVLVFHAWRFLPFLSDDALISLRYARRLLDGHGLTWTDGQPVEGYSNLLWVLAVAGLGGLGFDLIDAARGLGIASMVAVLVFVTGAYWRRAEGLGTAAAVTVALPALALSAPLAVWAVGGLEQPMVAALLAASVMLAYPVLGRTSVEYRQTVWCSVPLGLLCLTRPDGFLFTGAAAVSILLVGWIARQPRSIRHAVTLVTFPLLCFAGQLIFRLAYYGEIVPNTALVKIAGSATHRTFGVEYLSSGFWGMSPFSILALLALVTVLVVRRSRNRGILLMVSAALWGGYVAFIGGDIFPGYRHLIPLVVVGGFALAEGGALLAERLAPRPRMLSALVLAILAGLIPYARAQASDKWIRRASTERWEWQARDLAVTLKAAFGREQPLVAVTAAGSLPYWSELPSLDMMGLNDHYLPRHRPETFGSGMVGHELGDGKYVLDRRPDIIVFDVGSRQPSWRTGDELNAMPEFHARYAPVTLAVSSLEGGAVIYVDKYSERIGIRREPLAITVPGYLFTGPQTTAHLTAANALVAKLVAGQDARLSLDVDPARQWAVDSSGVDGIEGALQQKGGTLEVTVRAREGVVDLERLRLVGIARVVK